MKVYDKAKWHLDQTDDLRTDKQKLKHLHVIMDRLNEQNMLTEDGIEIYQLGIDQEFSLTSEMVTAEGKELLDRCYMESE